MKKELMRMQNVCYEVDSVEIIHNINFYILQGEIVGLVGKNHAGKSTLVGMLTGEYSCVSGQIWFQNNPLRIDSIQVGRKKGIFMVKSESSLIDNFTISDTFKLYYTFMKGRMRYPDYIKRCQQILEKMEVYEEKDTKIGQLNFHKQILMEISLALICDAKLIVMDGVFSQLSKVARDELKIILKKLKGQGVSVILVENSQELISSCLDRLCVLRDGLIVADLRREECQSDLILSLSEGQKRSANLIKKRAREPVSYHDRILQFDEVYSEDQTIRNLNFWLNQGEVLGIWNRNRHSGQAILDLLENKEKLMAGKIFYRDEVIADTRHNEAKKHHIFTVPEEDEIFTNMTFAENIQFYALKRCAVAGFIKNEGELKYLLHELWGKYFTDTGYHLSMYRNILNNRLLKKKVSLCQVLAAGAAVIVYCNPFSKLDVHETELFMHDIQNTQSGQCSQVVISAQLNHLYPICDRILQIEEGTVVDYIL